LADVIASPFPLAAVSQWYVTTRYPDLDAVLPTTAEVGEALETVASLINGIIAVAPTAAGADRSSS
jgi:hypothetical protein